MTLEAVLNFALIVIFFYLKNFNVATTVVVIKMILSFSRKAFKGYPTLDPNKHLFFRLATNIIFRGKCHYHNNTGILFQSDSTYYKSSCFFCSSIPPIFLDFTSCMYFNRFVSFFCFYPAITQPLGRQEEDNSTICPLSFPFLLVKCYSIYL